MLRWSRVHDGGTSPVLVFLSVLLDESPGARKIHVECSLTKQRDETPLASLQACDDAYDLSKSVLRSQLLAGKVPRKCQISDSEVCHPTGLKLASAAFLLDLASSVMYGGIFRPCC